MKISRILFFGISMVLSSCAFLHHTQIGEIDNRTEGEPFEILASETGINLKEAKSLLQAVTSSKTTSQHIGQASEIIGAFQMGPRTGNLIFDDSYSDIILEAIIRKCPNGKISGLNSIRESNKYPVVSGEIVKITGYCHYK